MKWVWVHSMRFQPRGEAVYGEAQLDYHIWERYLAHCSSLHVVGRGPEPDTRMHAKYVRACSGPRVTFSMLEGINSLRELLGNSASVAGELEEIIRSADGVIARLPSEHGLAAAAVAKRLGKPLAIELVGCAFDALWNHGDIRGKVYAPLMAARVRAAVAAAPFVLYVTREFLQQRYPARHIVGRASNVEIPGNAIAVSDVEVPLIEADAENRAQKVGEDLQIGLIGAFQNEYKGHGTALLALRKLAQDGLPARLRLIGVGDPTRWNELAQTLGVSDRVSFEGVLPPGNAVMNWLGELDVYIQPSLTEGLPRALIEAMASGRAAFASRVGGIPELIPADCLHGPGDWRGLASLLARAASDRVWRKECAQANRIKAQEYTAGVLGERRNRFWAQFADYCAGRRAAARLCA